MNLSITRRLRGFSHEYHAIQKLIEIDV
ncbi:hypothetical protein MRGR3_0204 [Staphylococcus aureus subsp. aureus MRGR3]|uniref:Uncharacterized protein n=1 Tax=Staphylococcus phage StauST398-3 TaxID=1195071 RepID=M9NUI6_9CAUD|nr:hypothetical protein M174_gp19 [Staphylococcus phage StauST398-3]AFN39819.1 hypothetical protein StauST398-3_0019 [Staphylococcus phage StauST398-3]EOR42139.1 hypothetical protein MRGR3_0204 [Staphylococcus aureus subsp. aureus MRGR3]